MAGWTVYPRKCAQVSSCDDWEHCRHLLYIWIYKPLAAHSGHGATVRLQCTSVSRWLRGFYLTATHCKQPEMVRRTSSPGRTDDNITSTKCAWKTISTVHKNDHKAAAGTSCMSCAPHSTFTEGQRPLRSSTPQAQVRLKRSADHSPTNQL